MAWNADWLALIDSRIDADKDALTAMGTIVERLTTNDALATFDGDAGAVPIKVGANVDAFEGDRVLLLRAGTEWVAVTTFSKWQLQDAGETVDGTPGSLTSGTYEPLPGNLSEVFVKRYDLTRVRLELDMSCYSTAIGTGVIAAININGFDWQVCRFRFEAASVHMSFSGFTRIPAIPAGTYTITPMWARYAGAGTLNLTADNKVSYGATEIAP
jgi:hypothetical protein